MSGSNYEAVKRYTRRQREDRGLVRMTVWVPSIKRAAVLKYAARLRQAARVHTGD